MVFTSASPPPSDPPLIPDGHYLDFSRTGIPWVDRSLDIATVGALVLVVICAVGFIAWTRWVKPALTGLIPGGCVKPLMSISLISVISRLALLR